jgi:hypothetical protein
VSLMLRADGSLRAEGSVPEIRIFPAGYAEIQD